MVYQNHKSRFFQVRHGVLQRSVLGSVLFSPSMIFLLLCLFLSAALFTLTIWPFGPPPPQSQLRWRPPKKLCFVWIVGLSIGDFLSILTNVRLPSSQWIPTRLTSNPIASYLAPASVSISMFFGITFDCTLSFFKHVSSLKAKFFPRLKALRCISASSWAPLRSSSFFYIKLFFSLFITGMVCFPKRYLLCLSAYSRFKVATADICIFITWHLFYGRMPFLPPTLYSEGKLGHLSST